MPEKDTAILASFSDGTAAIIMKKYSGGGKAILAAVPAIRAFAENQGWISLVKHVAKANQCAVDNDIWNFNFPYTLEKKPVFSSICLTGNHFYWWKNKPVKNHNAEIKGASYTVSLLPDHLKNTKHTGSFAFGKGNLTNRLSALNARDIANSENFKLVKTGQLRMDMFADTWSNPVAFDIHFQFGKNVQPSELVFYWQGELPDFTIRIPGRKDIQCKGGTTNQVLERRIHLPGVNTQTLIISLGKRTGKLTLSELEIWSNNK
jgi:hypothetical protein